jgi:predicted Zn finger-like uncharacterized protein
MVKLFWVKCPNCGGKFYVHTAEFRGQEREMRCPFCSTFFKDVEAQAIWEEDEPPQDW